jgi:DNA polymerase/3'-5' exonuclease PolX
MSTKPSTSRIPLARAVSIAETTQAALAPHCERIAIAGSVRRRKAFVGDLELVCIPRQLATGLFGDALVTDPDFCAVVNQ